MTLPVPEYLRIPGIQDPEIRYQWDDWNVEAFDLPIDEKLQARLCRISKRAVAAFTIGTAEWIVYRFAPLSPDPSPAMRLEAAWAQVIDLRYSPQRDLPMEDWRGPIRGPIGVAVRRAIFALVQADIDGDPAWRGGRASKLAEHVLPDPDPYRNWSESILERFERLYPVDPKESIGEVVPREALDPVRDFDISRTQASISSFLSRLDSEPNPFLNSPNVMVQQGFIGTPYLFDQQADHKARYEW